MLTSEHTNIPQAKNNILRFQKHALHFYKNHQILKNRSSKGEAMVRQVIDTKHYSNVTP